CYVPPSPAPRRHRYRHRPVVRPATRLSSSPCRPPSRPAPAVPEEVVRNDPAIRRCYPTSADSRANAIATVADLHLLSPVAYGVPPMSWLPRHCAQITNILLDTDGRVMLAVHSNGAIGRLMSGDVLGFLAHPCQPTSEGH